LDQPTPELLLVSLSGDTISFKKSLSLVEQARAAEFLTKVTVDPTGTVAVVSCYIGKLTVVRLHDGEFNASDAIPLK
jgi:DNA damage-binding protein 1